MWILIKSRWGIMTARSVNMGPLLRAFETLPRRIFLDSCTAQTLRDYDGFIYEGEPLAPEDRIHQVPDGLANVEALRAIFRLTERAQFEWIVSAGSLDEAADKRDAGHLKWLWDIADYSQFCLDGDGPSAESKRLAGWIAEPRFGYLSAKDRRLLADAVALRCEAFLTMERRLPRNAAPLAKELGIEVLTPIRHWELLRPWATLWL
jgi:hypothetical protein